MTAPGVVVPVIAARQAGDELLRRLPRAVWRALPALASSGVATLLIGVAVIWALGPASAWTPVAVGVLAAPLAAWAIDAVHGELFAEHRRVAWTRRLIVSELAVGVPTLLASSSLVASAAAEHAHLVAFQVVAVAGTLAVVVTSAVAVVMLPLGLVRGEVRLRSLVAVCAVATVRRPLAAFSTLAAASVIAWLGSTWFAGILIACAPALGVLAVAAAWATVVPFGVTLPELIPLRTRGRSTTRGEA